MFWAFDFAASSAKLSKNWRLCSGVNGSCSSDLRGSSEADTDTKDPNSEEELETARECALGLDVVAAIESNIGPGFGEAGGVGGENKVANKSSVSSPLTLDPLGGDIGGILSVDDIRSRRSGSKFIQSPIIASSESE